MHLPNLGLCWCCLSSANIKMGANYKFPEDFIDLYNSLPWGGVRQSVLWQGGVIRFITPPCTLPLGGNRTSSSCFQFPGTCWCCHQQISK